MRGNFTARFLPDGKRLVVGLDRQLSLYDAATGRPLTVLGRHDHRIIHLAVSPDGTRIASHGEGEKHIRLWDSATGREVAILRGHTVGPGALAFSPDGSRLASGSPYPDNSVRLWDSATGSADRHPVGPHQYDSIGRVQPGRPAPRLGLPRPDRPAVGRQRTASTSPCSAVTPIGSGTRSSPPTVGAS